MKSRRFPRNIAAIDSDRPIVLRVDDLQRRTSSGRRHGYVRRDNGESDDFVLLGPPDGAGPHLA